MLGVELRAAFQLARAELERGDLRGGGRDRPRGRAQRAEQRASAWRPYGLDLQYLHYLAHYADGCWDHAAELADGFPVRATTAAEARLSAMALFLDVARGSPAVAERRAWLEPFWAGDSFGAYIARGLLAEHALWRGDTATALAEVAATLADRWTCEGGYGPPVIRVAAVGLAARGDRARRARAAGDDETAAGRGERGPGADRRPPGRAPPTRAGPSSCWAWTAAAGWPAPRRSGAGPGASNDPAGLAGGGGHVRPRVRLRDRAVPLAAGRGAGRGGAARPRPSRSGRSRWPSPTSWAPCRC